MTGVLVNRIHRTGQGMTDYGFYTDERGVEPDPELLSDLVDEDRAYTVEVFENRKGMHIRLRSDDRRIASELQSSLELEGHGLDESKILKEYEDPRLPHEYENPHRALDMYAEYALEHGHEKGIDMDVDWDDLMDDENLDRR